MLGLYNLIESRNDRKLENFEEMTEKKTNIRAFATRAKNNEESSNSTC